jgi:Zn-dependent peptidase ImmA (M78 family)
MGRRRIVKKEVAMKYPHAAHLFTFCRRVLDHKYGGIRVIDQDVGQILGFDPADCSHWKKGKKNIRSIQAVSNIADFLQVDRSLVSDLAAGKISEIDAYFEYAGYGPFAIDSELVEIAKKDYYRRYASWWSKEKEQEFKSYFTIDLAAMDAIVAKIHSAISLREPPVFLPEIAAHYPAIILKPEEQLPQSDVFPPLHTYLQGNQYVISYQAGMEDRPAMRFRIAKALAGYFFSNPQPLLPELKSYQKQVQAVQGNLFAARLLVPLALLQREIAGLESVKDTAEQLAEIFWVSKGLINRRIRDVVMQHK